MYICNQYVYMYVCVYAYIYIYIYACPPPGTHISLFSCKEENSFQGYHIDTSETGAKDICVVDIDKDGDLDILGVNFNSGGVFKLENIDGINFEKTNTHTEIGSTIKICAVDFDGDSLNSHRFRRKFLEFSSISTEFSLISTEIP